MSGGYLYHPIVPYWQRILRTDHSENTTDKSKSDIFEVRITIKNGIYITHLGQKRSGMQLAGCEQSAASGGITFAYNICTCIRMTCVYGPHKDGLSKRCDR